MRADHEPKTRGGRDEVTSVAVGVAQRALDRLELDELLAILQALERVLAAKLAAGTPLSHAQAQAAVLASPVGVA